MATLTISDEIFERLTRQAQTVNSSPEVVAESVLQSYLETQTDLTPIRTLGDLLAHVYGLWANRVVLEDTVAYVARLRAEAWRRGETSKKLSVSASLRDNFDPLMLDNN